MPKSPQRGAGSPPPVDDLDTLAKEMAELQRRMPTESYAVLQRFQTDLDRLYLRLCAIEDDSEQCEQLEDEIEGISDELTERLASHGGGREAAPVMHGTHHIRAVPAVLPEPEPEPEPGPKPKPEPELKLEPAEPPSRGSDSSEELDVVEESEDRPFISGSSQTSGHKTEPDEYDWAWHPWWPSCLQLRVGD